ncbi:MAG: ATP-binding protein, partial [Nitrospinota bacterium]
AQTYYRETEGEALAHARRLAASLATPRGLKDAKRLKALMEPKLDELLVDSIQLFNEEGRELLKLKRAEAPGTTLFYPFSDLMDKALGGEAISEIRSVGRGDLIRGLAPIRLPGKGGKVLGLVAVTYYVPQSLTAKLADIRTAFENYKQMEIQKDPIKASYVMTFLMIALLVIFAAIWFGFYLARGITVPIEKLAEGTRAVAEGNLDFKIDLKADDEVGLLVDAFNRMTSNLKRSGEKLEEAHRGLQRTNVELERRRSYMETVLQNIATGVITVDHRGRITTINKAAGKMLELDIERARGKSYLSLFSSEQLAPVRALLKKMLDSGRESLSEQIQMRVGGRVLTLIASVSLLTDRGGQGIGMVVVFEDLTELIKAQKLAAWREVAQGIAHEIKNPLTPIQLSTQRLKKKFETGAQDFAEVFQTSTTTIITQVKSLMELVNEFSQFARLPEAHPRPCDLHALLSEVLSLYRESHRHLEFETRYEATLEPVSVDEGQIKRVFINLLENAIESMGDGGKITISTFHDRMNQSVRIEVADEGEGLPTQSRERLFMPYFSTKKGGRGLGLALVQRIIADHNGSIEVRDNHPKGTVFVIRLPLDGASARRS